MGVRGAFRCRWPTGSRDLPVGCRGHTPARRRPTVKSRPEGVCVQTRDLCRMPHVLFVAKEAHAEGNERTPASSPRPPASPREPSLLLRQEQNGWPVGPERRAAAGGAAASGADAPARLRSGSEGVHGSGVRLTPCRKAAGNVPPDQGRAVRPNVRSIDGGPPRHSAGFQGTQPC